MSLAYDFQWNTLDATFTCPPRAMAPSLSDALHPYGGIGHGFEWGRLKMQASVLGYFVHEKSRALRSPARQGCGYPCVFRIVQSAENHDLSVRAFYKRMFRMPTFNDLYYTDMGNAFLKPEYAEQFNVGLKYTRNFEKSPFMRMLDVSVDAYYNKITDKIIAYPKGQQFRWTMLNLGEVEIKGAWTPC